MVAHFLSPFSQTALFEEDPSTWASSDDWETPTWLAKAMAGRSHKRTLELAAGTGQIAQFLPVGSVCVELNALRVEIGKRRAPHCAWYLGDSTTPAIQGVIGKFDTIITNPPFSVGIEFVRAAANLLSPEGLAHYLLPSAYFQSKERGMAFYKIHRATGLSIVGVTNLVGRAAYLRDGVPESGRMCDDSIFTLGFGSSAVDFLFAE